MKLSLIAIVTVCLSFTACNSLHRVFHKEKEIHIPTVNNNVCKKLKGHVVLYAIFVDSKHTRPWTEYDINSTLDSIQVAADWIEEQGKLSKVDLDIEIAYHQDKKKVIPIAANFTRKTLSSTLLMINGIRNVDRWADKVGKEALKTLGPDKSKVTKTKIKPKDRERLIARLRDIHKTDNVAVMYFINNYFTDEISVAMHTGHDYTPEYAIVSYKQPGVIAHEFMHLFGALDLYITPFDNRRKSIKKKAFAMKEFPNEIMAFPYRNLNSLEIGTLTEYLIGWDNQLDKYYKDMIFGKKLKIAKY